MLAAFIRFLEELIDVANFGRDLSKWHRKPCPARRGGFGERAGAASPPAQKVTVMLETN